MPPLPPLRQARNTRWRQASVCAHVGVKAPHHVAQTNDAGIPDEAPGRVSLDMSIDDFLDGGFEDVAAAGGSSDDGAH